MSTKDAIAMFFQRYAASFTECDVESITGLWAFPAVITVANRSGAFTDTEAFESNTRMLCDFYKRQGMHRAEKTVLSIEELYPSVVIARTKDELFARDDTLIAAWEHVYLLRKSGHGWRAITAVAEGELEAWAERGTPLGNE